MQRGGGMEGCQGYHQETTEMMINETRNDTKNDPTNDTKIQRAN